MKVAELFEAKRSSRSSKIPLKKAIKWAELNALGALSALSKSPIYRGVTQSGNAYFVDPSKFTRTSANTENYYTLLMDNLPAWKGWPRRSKSLIASTHYDAADEFGNIFLVIPADGAIIAVAPDNDLWHSFKFTSSLEDFNTEISNFFKYEPKISWKNLEKMLKTVDKEADLDEEGMGDDLMTVLKPALTGKVKNGVEAFDQAMDPKKNNFSKSRAGSFKAPVDREVWTEGPAVLIGLESDYSTEDTKLVVDFFKRHGLKEPLELFIDKHLYAKDIDKLAMKAKKKHPPLDYYERNAPY